MPERDRQAVIDWYREVIRELRARADLLSDLERSAIPNTDRFTQPFQASVLWVTDPDWQFVIHSNLEDRPDGRVEVSGPHPFTETLDELETFLADPFWDGPLPSDSYRFRLQSGPPSLREALSSVLAAYARTIQFNPYGPRRPPGPGMGQAISPEVWIWLVSGSISDIKPSLYVDGVVERARQNAVQRQKQASTPAPSPAEEVQFLSSDFSPPIFVGELPLPHTLKEFYGGTSIPASNAPLKRWMIGELSVRLYQLGWMVVSTDKPTTALRLFNLIYALCNLDGLGTDPISVADLGEVWLDSSGENPHRWSNRRGLFPFFGTNSDELQRMGVREIKLERLDKILGTTRLVASNPELVDDLNFWLESESHRRHQQFSQALVMGWLVVERFLSSLWRSHLTARHISGQRLKTLTRSPDWTIDHIIEVLEISEEALPASYADLKRIKTARNRLVHSGEIPSAAEVQALADISTRIVRTRVDAIRPPSSDLMR